MTKPPSPTIADLLRAAREQANLTQHQAAKATGVSIGYIARLEVGMKNDPSLSTLRKLAAGYGVTLSELVEGLE